MDGHGYPWMKKNNYPWISMDIHRYPWTSMDVFSQPKEGGDNDQNACIWQTSRIHFGTFHYRKRTG
jgi:hypothetical protein